MDIKKILVPVDGSDESRKALDTAVYLAKRCSASVILFHVVDLNQEMSDLDRVTMSGYVPSEIGEKGYRLLAELARGVPESIPLAIDSAIGAPGECILQKQKETGADLIIMGSRGLGAMRGFVMGSVSQTVLHKADCMVMMVKCQRDL